jgi:enoyl-CoA hydratase
MTDSDSMYIEKHENIATLFFDRPDKRNALSFEMWSKIPQLLAEVEEDNQIKVLILRGIDEKAFSAGADISEFNTHRSTPESAEKYRRVTGKAEKSLAELSKPTISMIQGYCIGGGCELAVASDFRFSDTSGKFAITPSKLGFVYHFSGTQQLFELIGPSKTKDILFSGRILDADEAFRIGLIDRFYTPEEIVGKTYEYAQLLARNSQTTISGAKKIINEIHKGKTKEDEMIARMILSSYQSSDYIEGVQAFNEKRRPIFT